MPSQQTSQTVRSTRWDAFQKPPSTVTTATCHCCDESGHISKNCPKINMITKNDWHSKHAVAAYQKPDSTAGSDNEQSAQITKITRTSSSVAPANGRSGAHTGNNQHAGNWLGFQSFNLQMDVPSLPTMQVHAEKSFLGYQALSRLLLLRLKIFTTLCSWPPVLELMAPFAMKAFSPTFALLLERSTYSLL